MRLISIFSCDCNGFSDSCDLTKSPYECKCQDSSFTTGSKVYLKFNISSLKKKLASEFHGLKKNIQ